MATTAITINVDNSILAEVEQYLCAAAGLPNTPANAKQAVINLIRGQCYSVIVASQTPPAPPTDPTAGLLT